jgi:BMFP domain-containing protein YqiC
MLNADLIEKVTAAARRAFPQGLGADAERNLRAALESLFNRLDLVTREEFEVQQAVLARTRAKLEQLEKQIAALEEKHKKA